MATNYYQKYLAEGRCTKCGGCLPEGYEYKECNHCRDLKKMRRKRKKAEEDARKEAEKKEAKNQAILWTSYPVWQGNGESATGDSYASWMGADRELKRIRCPECNTKHFWTRPDRKELQEKGEVRIDCQCGEHYWVVMNKDGRGSHIRANRREE